MRAHEFLKESTTTLNKLYNGNFPDRDESFWDEVRPHEFDNELEVKVLPKHKLAIMIQSQYRVEHLDELLDMMDEDQQEILQRYMNDPNLSNKIILLSGDRIIDGNHRALAAAMKGMSINYVDLAELDEQDVTEDTNKLSYIGNCTDDDVIEHLFGDATGFAQAVEEYGDDFELDDLVVKYDPETDIHSFYYKQKGVAEGKQQVERDGIQLDVSIDGAKVDIRPMINGNQIGYVVFDRDGKTLVADDLAIDEKYRGRGIAKIIYDYVKELGFTVKRSTDQLAAGKAFWDKYKGAQGQVWEDENVDEMALSTYKTMGDFSKPGPFTGADKKLVPHPKNIEKATRFFEQTPFDFRLFFSHLKGTGKYSEHGPMSPDQIKQVFGQDSEEIINGSEDAITVVYVGNKGDAKVMLTPWMMAHRFGHAINAGARNKNWTAWGEAEKYFFQTVNNLLDEHYGKVPATKPPGRNMLFQLTPEYNALFNAMGTQRSSTSGQIRRPYEFLYELFAQYLGTGKVTLNPLPTNLGYGRRVFGNPTKYMNIKPEYRDEGERKQAADSLAYTMELLFNDVLSDSVGKIFVM